MTETTTTKKRRKQIDDEVDLTEKRRAYYARTKHYMQTPPKPITSDGLRPDEFVQENLLSALCRDDEFGKKIADTIDATLFEGDLRIVAERVIKYWTDYHEAPKSAHLADLFSDILAKKHARQNTYKRILDAALELAPQLNTKLVDDQLHKFHFAQMAKVGSLKLVELLQAGKMDEYNEQLRSMAADPTFTPKTGALLTTRTLDQFEYRDVEWLWWPFVPLSEVTTIYGQGGSGKSSITIDMAVRIAMGKPWPRFGDEKEEEIAPLGSVLIATREDDPYRVIRPRLEAAGADVAALRRIHFVGYDVPDDATEFEPLQALDTRMDALERKIMEIGDVRLVVIDPATDFIGKLENNATSQIRASMISPLARIARKHDLAVVLILHVNKKEDASPRNRATGTEAWVNAPRSAVLVGAHPDDPMIHVMVQEKFNLTPAGTKHAASFYTETVRAVHRIKWEREWSEVTAEQILSPHKGETKLDKAKLLLQTWLAKGPVGSTDLIAQAKDVGISKRTLLNAKQQLKLRSRKTGFHGDWLWSLRKDAKR